MNRRSFGSAVGGLVVMSPWPSLAQKTAGRVIGFLGSATPGQWADRLAAFRNALSEQGFVEGRNLLIEYRWAEGDNSRIPSLAAELVRARVHLIAVLGSTLSAQAAKAATSTIPIVFRIAADPVQAGLVDSLSRPGANLTGITTLGLELGEKQLQLLSELLPNAKSMALFVNPTSAALAQPQSAKLTAAAVRLGLQLQVINISSDRDIETAFDELSRRRVDGLIIGPDTFFNSRNQQFAALAIRHAIPAISAYREFTDAGGLMSYGGSIPDAARLAGLYAARILKGESPADLPVVQAVKIEVVINLKTAGKLALSVPPTVLARADEVIE
jgi:putative tryptophan/tyrosine transport system substrate-binding protein